MKESENLRGKLWQCRQAPRFSKYPLSVRREAMRYVQKRSEQGVEAKQLAGELGVSQTTVAAWLRRAKRDEQLAQGLDAKESRQTVSFERVPWPASMSEAGATDAVADAAAAAAAAGVTVHLSRTDGATVRVEGLSERGAVDVLVALAGRQR